MARDPLDTAIVVMLEQARSVVVQLRDTASGRAALAGAGEDPDALAAGLDAVRTRAWTANDDHLTAKRDGAALRARGKLLVVAIQRWFVQLANALAIGEAMGDTAVSAAAADVRSTYGPERRTVPKATAAMRAAMGSLRTHVAVLSRVPTFIVVNAAGETLLGHTNAYDTEQVQAGIDLARLARENLAGRHELLAALRDVRRLWTAAADLSDSAVIDLDLRISKAAVAQARRRKKPMAAAQPLAGQPAGPALAEAVAPGAIADADAGVPDPGSAPDACNAPVVAITAQIVVA